MADVSFGSDYSRCEIYCSKMGSGECDWTSSKRSTSHGQLRRLPGSSSVSSSWTTFTCMMWIHLVCGTGEFLSWILYMMYPHPPHVQLTAHALYTDSLSVHIFILANLYVTAAILLLIERRFPRRRTLSVLISLVIIGIGVPSLREILRAYIFSPTESTFPLLSWLLVLPVALCVVETTGAIYLIIVAVDDMKVRRFLIWRSPDKERALELVIVNHPH